MEFWSHGKMDIEKFLGLVGTKDWDDAINCWIWKGIKYDNGYGRFGDERAHRIMYELVHGSIPNGLNVCHDCLYGDNPSCVNPYHLWVGTQKENIQDAMQKGRMWNSGQRSKVGKFMLGNKYTLGWHPSEEIRGKLSKLLLGNKRTLGHRLTEEHKRKIGLGNKGKTVSEETKKKMGESMQGNKNSLGYRNALGYRHTIVARLKIISAIRHRYPHKYCTTERCPKMGVKRTPVLAEED